MAETRNDLSTSCTEDKLNSYGYELENCLSELDDDTYRNLIGNAIHRLDLIQMLREAPYGLHGPMSFKGGLIMHTVHSLRTCKALIDQNKEIDIPLNESLIISGCLLRNIGWYTTTRIMDNKTKERDAYYMTSIYRASFRFVHQLMLSTNIDLQIEIPESKIQALENLCNPLANIYTLEGKIVAMSDMMTDVLHCGSHDLSKEQKGNWCNELFVGHNA